MLTFSFFENCLQNEKKWYKINVLGEVSEWSNVHAWKACVVKATAGSNPVLSAKANKSLFEKTFFYEIPIPFFGNVISLPLLPKYCVITKNFSWGGEKFFSVCNEHNRQHRTWCARRKKCSIPRNLSE